MIKDNKKKKKKKKKKKWHGPLSHKGREGITLMVRPLKKNTFLFPYELDISPCRLFSNRQI